MLPTSVISRAARCISAASDLLELNNEATLLRGCSGGEVNRYRHPLLGQYFKTLPALDHSGIQVIILDDIRASTAEIH